MFVTGCVRGAVNVSHVNHAFAIDMATEIIGHRLAIILKISPHVGARVDNTCDAPH